jgi:hypothetical protein
MVTMKPSPKELATVQRLLAQSAYLSRNLPAKLPSSVRVAIPSDTIHTVFSREEGESQWHTFNSRFDAVFGEDCRDKTTKKLHLIRRGPLGMELVANYLDRVNIKDPELPLGLVIPKLQRLYNELIGLS